MAAESEEGTVQWDAAEAFFAGKAKEGAPEGEPEKPAQESLVEVSIKGQKVQMTKQAADAYSDFVRDTRERDGRLGGELSQLRERSARLEGAIESLRTPKANAEPDIKPPPPDLAIENFAEWQRQFTHYQAAMMMRQQAEMETKYQSDQEARVSKLTQDQTSRRWADSFFTKNPHLNKPHLRAVVQSVYTENARDIDDLSEAEAHDRLSELANNRVIAIRTDGQDVTVNPPRLEGGGTPTPRGGGKETAFVPVSAADWSSRKRAELRGDKKKAAR